MTNQPGPDGLRALADEIPITGESAASFRECEDVANGVRAYANAWKAERIEFAEDWKCVFRQYQVRIEALERDKAILQEGRALAEALVLSHEGHIEKLKAENTALREWLEKEPPWFTERMDRIESILFRSVTRRGR